MTASVIIPHLKSPATLPRTLESVRAAAAGLQVEEILVEDVEARGAAWARNQGLARATGDAVFFVDADDTVAPDFFSKPLAALERSGADMCFFAFNDRPLARDYNLDGNAQVRDVLLPAFFGYSFESVRRWNAGGSLWQGRELGYVWRVALKRAFLERHALRFDESLYICEDAAFLSACAVFADKTVSLGESLYRHDENPHGTYRTVLNTRRHWDYKFAVKAFRERLDAQTGGAIWRYCAASCVFSALELMRLWRPAGLTRREGRAALKRYLDDAKVHAALRDFPLSWRHPLVAAAVLYLRSLAP